MEKKDRFDLYNHIKQLREQDKKESVSRLLYAGQMNEDRGKTLSQVRSWTWANFLTLGWRRTINTTRSQGFYRQETCILFIWSKGKSRIQAQRTHHEICHAFVQRIQKRAQWVLCDQHRGPDGWELPEMLPQTHGRRCASFIQVFQGVQNTTETDKTE